MLKPEPMGNFVISDGSNLTLNDHYVRHVSARRLGAMEVMTLLLGLNVCKSDIQVIYLTTDMQSVRTKTVKFAYMLAVQDDDDSPFFEDAIEKYLGRPNDQEFDDIKYADYFCNYSIHTKRPVNTRLVWQDAYGNYITPKSKKILARFSYRKFEDGEPFFYHQLLLKLPSRSEETWLGNFATYKEHFVFLYAEEYERLLTTANRQTELRDNFFAIAYQRIIDHVTIMTPPTVRHLIELQMNVLRPHFGNSMQTHLNLNDEQYRFYTILTTNWGPISGNRHNHAQHPCFFLTGGAGTGKSYLTKLMQAWLESGSRKYLLLAPTGVAAINVDGQTIHSCLRLFENDSGAFQTLLFQDENLLRSLRRLTHMIIDEISMVSAQLLNFVSSLLSRIKNNSMPFGGISVLVVGDLFQLPPVKGSHVFYSIVWKYFYPLILSQPVRQRDDPTFFELLKAVRVGQLTNEHWQLLESRMNHGLNTNELYSSTFICGNRATASMINNTLLNTLPLQMDVEPISYAIDHNTGFQYHDMENTDPLKRLTNLPRALHLRLGSRIMFLTNDFIDSSICNGSIGIIREIKSSENGSPLCVKVIFPTGDGALVLDVKKKRVDFNMNGRQASRFQFPIQNAHALTVHKTQSITLDKITLSLDETFFAPGQAYVALSRARRLEDVIILALIREAIRVDVNVLREHERLVQLAEQIRF